MKTAPFLKQKGFFSFICMTVFNPEHTTHSLKIIPRQYVDGDVVVLLKDKETNNKVSYTLPQTTLNGYMNINITHVFKDMCDYSIEILDGNNNTIYRGKIFTTTQQDLQDFNLTKDVFTT